MVLPPPSPLRARSSRYSRSDSLKTQNTDPFGPQALILGIRILVLRKA